MPTTCVFEFDRPEPVYYSGEVINGKVILKTTSPKPLNGIYIFFEAEGKVHWRQQHCDKSTDFDSNETYLETNATLQNDIILPPGTHTYTFSIPIPSGCPSSVEQKYGNIFYELSIVFNRSSQLNKICAKRIIILHSINLNQHPEYLLPMKQEDITQLCCWPCTTEPIISTLTLPSGVFKAGQPLNYKLEIDNQSGYDISGITLKLKQNYTFTAHSPEKTIREIKNTLAKIVHPERVLRLSKRELNDSLAIPMVTSSTERDDIIKVDYVVVMTLVTLDFRKKIQIVMPIRIGLLQGLGQSLSNSSEIHGSPPPSVEANAPPTFAEAMIARVRREHSLPDYSSCTNVEPTAPQQELPNTPRISHQQQQLSTRVERNIGWAPVPLPEDTNS